jgi:hypothetical protein
MANRDLQAELELYKEAFFTKDNSKLIEFYRPVFPNILYFANWDTLYGIAIRSGNCHAISLIYELGDQNYHTKSGTGCSPLELAVCYRNKECIQTLLEIPEFQHIDKNIFLHINDMCYDDDAGFEMIMVIMEAAFRLHKIDYFGYPKRSASKLSRILRAVYGNQQDNVNEDDVLQIRYRVFVRSVIDFEITIEKLITLHLLIYLTIS